MIGDRKTGKTAVAIDAILNQKNTGVKCFYVAIGQKDGSVARVVEALRKYGAMDYTTVIVSGASTRRAAPIHCTLLRYGHGGTLYVQRPHALIVYDDLSKQATAYRQLSLLMRRPPGREAYPVTCSIATAACWSVRPSSPMKWAGGSLTSLPIIETLEGEVSAYIPTNVISITDGQIYFAARPVLLGCSPSHERRYLSVARRW